MGIKVLRLNDPPKMVHRSTTRFCDNEKSKYMDKV